MVQKTENITAEEKDPWELHDRIFSEEHMYGFVERTAKKLDFTQTLTALPLMKKYHAGQRTKGSEAIPNIYHPLLMACHACALGLKEDELIATILLHDVCEDCGIEPSELDVNATVQEAVRCMTYKRLEGETWKTAHDRYYETIGTNRLATITKVIDRCNNISTMMGTFSRKRMIEYINETEKYIMPLLDKLKFGYEGRYYDAAFLLKYHLLSVMDNDKHAICKL